MRFLKAERIFSGIDYLPADTVLVVDDEGFIKDLLLEPELDKSQIERFEGILSPGFVNAHCHLELSHFKDKIPQKTGLPGFALEVVKQRGNFPAEFMEDAMSAADRGMWENGIVAVGDISNGSDSFKTKTSSKIHYHTFIELIGLNPKNADSIFEKGKEQLKMLWDLGLAGSLAPHAAYSTSKELIHKIAGFDQHNKSPFSIHNQESPEEAKFFMGEPNGFMKLYDFLNLDISWFKAPEMSSLKYYGGNLSEKNALLVHNTFTNQSDINFVKHKNVIWCFCPCANKYIENTLPDFSIFEAENICIGTDSLASNLGLDLLEEINLIAEESNHFSMQQLLKAVTYNAARALGIEEKFGQLLPGKRPGLNLLKKEDTKLKFIKKIC
ncbi:MAG: amidohydrolase family protein [Bacteroidia bacterium]|nr:amidohydrolase family protein [Bacteroidia bacterium]